MFSHPFEHAFGLDINDLSLKLVALRSKHPFSSNAFVVDAIKTVALPHGIIANGELQDPEHVRKALLALLGKQRKGDKKIRSSWVIASLPENKSFLRHIQIEKPPEDILEDDVLAVATRHMPFDAKDYFFDWQIVDAEESGKYTDVIVGALPRLIVNSYTYLLESVGLGVVALEIEPLAIARAMITADKVYENEARAILDIGSTKSTLVLYDHNSIQASMTLPFSGELITLAISEQLGISYDEAEQYKKTHGLSIETGKHRPIPLLKNLIHSFVSDIKKAFLFYQTHGKDPNPVTHITLCGGASQTKQLSEIISFELKIPAEPGHVWKNLHTARPPKGYENAVELSTAIGLALRAAENPFSTSHR